MIIISSPLEQFNVLSIYDFSVSNLMHFEIIFLFSTWHIFYNYPVSVCNSTLSFIHNDLPLFWMGVNFFSTLYVTFLSYLLPFIYYLADLSLVFFLVLQDTTRNTSLAFLWCITVEAFNYLSINIFCAKHNLSFIYGYWGVLAVNLWHSAREAIFSVQIWSIETRDLSWLIFSLNTSALWASIAFLVLLFLFKTSLWETTLIAKNRWQTLMEIFYEVILNVVNENAGPKGRKFFPLIFTSFAIILACNVLGMIPYSFTVTSHLIVTFTVALAIFSAMNIIGILKHRKHFLSLFFPPGAPLALAPLLVLIELISYIFRVLSLSIRLFANLMSGHTLLKILATFSWGVVSFWGIFLAPAAVILIVTGLEMAIAFLQAYIFSVLLCIYLNDAFNLH